MESLKNFETAFQKIQGQAKMTVLACLGVTALVCWFAFDYVAKSADRAYAITNSGAAVELKASSIRDNRKVEAEHHVHFYHDLMFNISPDPRSIEYNKQRAEFLGDKTLLLPYDLNKENNFYNQLIGGNMRQEFRKDSIHVEMKTFPYQVIMYGRVIVTRSSSKLIKSLVTSCNLVDVDRSDNNSNGFLMQNFSILENKQISYESK